MCGPTTTTVYRAGHYAVSLLLFAPVGFALGAASVRAHLPGDPITPAGVALR